MKHVNKVIFKDLTIKNVKTENIQKNQSQIKTILKKQFPVKITFKREPNYCNYYQKHCS